MVSPSPSANKVSVTVGTTETIRCGGPGDSRLVLGGEQHARTRTTTNIPLLAEEGWRDSLIEAVAPGWSVWRPHTLIWIGPNEFAFPQRSFAEAPSTRALPDNHGRRCFPPGCKPIRSG